jgi:hypothetical protein
MEGKCDLCEQNLKNEQYYTCMYKKYKMEICPKQTDDGDEESFDPQDPGYAYECPECSMLWLVCAVCIKDIHSRHVCPTDEDFDPISRYFRPDS